MSVQDELFNDLIYLLSIFRRLPNHILDEVEKIEKVDFDRIMATLRKAGYEQTKWPLPKVQEGDGGNRKIET